jgi:hypothetical protein
MDSKIQERLSESTSKIRFSELKTEILADVIILVSKNLDLMAVAEACAVDDTSSFQDWMSKGLIRKPEGPEIESLKEEDALHMCCLVKPFVFLQKVMVS